MVGLGVCLHEGRDPAVVSEAESVVSDNLGDPHVGLRLCPAQLWPGGPQVF